MFLVEHTGALATGLTCLALAAGGWFLHARQTAALAVAGVLALSAAGVVLADRLVETDREQIESLFPRLAEAVEHRDAAAVLAAIDPAIRPLRDEVEHVLATLRPDEILVTRLDVAVDRAASPRTATAGMLVRYRGDVGGPGAPATGQLLVALEVDLHKPQGTWLITAARVDEQAAVGGRRPGGP